MTAYMVVANRVFDEPKFWSGYAAAATKLVKAWGGKYRIMAGQSEVLEGGADCEGAAIIIAEWPDMETVRKFWNSPEYAEVKKLRAGISDVRVWITEASWLSDEEGEALIGQTLAHYSG